MDCYAYVTGNPTTAQLAQAAEKATQLAQAAEKTQAYVGIIGNNFEMAKAAAHAKTLASENCFQRLLRSCHTLFNYSYPPTPTTQAAVQLAEGHCLNGMGLHGINCG